jgi:transposase
MGQNFIACDREQELLLPPSLREWLPADHFVWFVLDAVQTMELEAFFGVYRRDGQGRPAHDPGMMVALLVYAYARGRRSSRGIERACSEDVAFRVITVNEVPDHTTVARFRQRHETALAGLFGDVLALCADAGLVGVEVLAVDGTKLHANASGHANRDYEQLARDILAEADAVDSAEDEQLGDRRGGELPPLLSTQHGRLGWLRDAKQRLDAQRAEQARPIPRSRPARLKESKRRLDEELWTECQANAAYEAWRERGVMSNGRVLNTPVKKPYTPPEIPVGKINVTDPDSRTVKVPKGFIQGYNAQAVVNEQRIVIGAELSTSSPDFGLLAPTVTAALRELVAAGVTDLPGVLLADAGYWHQDQMDQLRLEHGLQVLIPPDAGNRTSSRPGWNGGRYAFMRRVLQTELGKAFYNKRKALIEPVFGHTKFNRRIERFQRRGLAACRSEWRLIAATHNLTKLYRHHLAAAVA